MFQNLSKIIKFLPNLINLINTMKNIDTDKDGKIEFDEVVSAIFNVLPDMQAVAPDIIPLKGKLASQEGQMEFVSDMAMLIEKYQV